jgi:flagellar basal-body rod modification protein FlgD
MNIQSLVAMTTGQQRTQASFLDNTATSIETETETETETNTETSASLATTTETTGEEFSTFLTLLTAQIRNQDPLAPLDSTQFVEQLATFTNLELQAKGNAELENISALLAQSVFSSTLDPETSTGVNANPAEDA